MTCSLRFPKLISSLLIACCLPFAATAQTDETADELLNQMEQPKQNVFGTFNSTRLVNLHTNETAGQNVLEFRITHRFGPTGGGGHTLWGLDNSSDIRIGFDYGITNNLMVGIGRSKQNERIDGFVKYRLLQQKEKGGSPIAVTLFANAAYDPSESVGNVEIGSQKFEEYPNFASRMSYVSQVILSRKFHHRFSFAVMPTYMHRNFMGSYADDYYIEPATATQPSRLVVGDNNQFAMGMGAKVRVSPTVTLTADYLLPFSEFLNDRPEIQGVNSYYHPIGLGVELEVGGHIFQINATNSEAILINNMLQRSPTSLDAGGWRLGFCIVRVFTPGKRIVKSKREEGAEGNNSGSDSGSPGSRRKTRRLPSGN